MGTRHYHYLLPLVPLLALNIARIDLISKKSKFKLEASFAGVMSIFYLLGAYVLYIKREEIIGTSFYIGFLAAILSSVLCLCVFYVRVISGRKISHFALIFAFIMAQYLTIFALSASGIIWSTNRELKALAISVNSECSSGAYLYGLSSKDVTVLRFYLDDSYILESLGSLSSAPSRCLVSSESSKKQILQDISDHEISKFYFK